MNVLMSVSGVIPTDLDAQVAAGTRPQADYVVMAREFGADLIDVAAARAQRPRLARVIEKIGGTDVLLAWACFRSRSRYQTIVTDGEQIGLPLALLQRLSFRKFERHLMIVHVLSVPKKKLLMKAFRLASQIDTMFVYSSWQKRYIESEFNVAPSKVVLTTFMVDTTFFSPGNAAARPRNAICSAGLEHRDYRTLIEATRDLPIDVVIASGSPWSTNPDLLQGETLPSNVEVCQLSHFDLRQLYADCKFVVVPLAPVEFQAGVTTILEAMAMGKCVICTKTPGQTDVIEHERTGLYIDPENPQMLRTAIQRLIDDPDLALRLGEAGRLWVEQADLDSYAASLARFVQAERLPEQQSADFSGGPVNVELRS